MGININIKKFLAGVVMAFTVAAVPFLSVSAYTSNHSADIQANGDQTFQCDSTREYQITVYNNNTGRGSDRYNMIMIAHDGNMVRPYSSPINVFSFWVTANNSQELLASLEDNLSVRWVSGGPDYIPLANINNYVDDEDLSECSETIIDTIPVIPPALKPPKTAVY